MTSSPLQTPQITREEETEAREETERPYRVIVHNDEVTPYDFVIVVLVRIFQVSPIDAEAITLSAHSNGLAQVAVLPLNEANKRVGRAHFAAALEGYPLSFSVEPE
jgi:ATP-dependent Clp protease adaptor protein ClpS